MVTGATSFLTVGQVGTMDAGSSAIAAGVAVLVVLLGLVTALFVLGRSPAAQVGIGDFSSSELIDWAWNLQKYTYIDGVDLRN